MSYIAKADIIEQLPNETLIQLTDDEGTGAAVDFRVDAAIEDAEGEVNGYLSSRYAVPLSPAPAIVKKVAVDIAIYNLYARRLGAPDDRAKRYENAVRLLKDISKGLVSLGVSPPPVSDIADTVKVSSQERVFTRDSLKVY